MQYFRHGTSHKIISLQLLTRFQSHEELRFCESNTGDEIVDTLKQSSLVCAGGVPLIVRVTYHKFTFRNETHMSKSTCKQNLSQSNENRDLVYSSQINHS
jgi:hypothetical protein